MERALPITPLAKVWWVSFERVGLFERKEPTINCGQIIVLSQTETLLVREHEKGGISVHPMKVGADVDMLYWSEEDAKAVVRKWYENRIADAQAKLKEI